MHDSSSGLVETKFSLAELCVGCHKVFMVLLKPTDRLLQTIRKGYLKSPTERLQFFDVQELSRRPVGLGKVMLNSTSEANYVGNKLGKFKNCDIDTGSDVDVTVSAIRFHQVNAGVRTIIHIKEFTSRITSTPRS